MSTLKKAKKEEESSPIYTNILIGEDENLSTHIIVYVTKIEDILNLLVVSKTLFYKIYPIFHKIRKLCVIKKFNTDDSEIKPTKRIFSPLNVTRIYVFKDSKKRKIDLIKMTKLETLRLNIITQGTEEYTIEIINYPKTLKEMYIYSVETSLVSFPNTLKYIEIDNYPFKIPQLPDSLQTLVIEYLSKSCLHLIYYILCRI